MKCSFMNVYGILSVKVIRNTVQKLQGTVNMRFGCKMKLYNSVTCTPLISSELVLMCIDCSVCIGSPLCINMSVVLSKINLC
jgi:hypothetical protein